MRPCPHCNNGRVHTGQYENCGACSGDGSDHLGNICGTCHGSRKNSVEITQPCYACGQTGEAQQPPNNTGRGGRPPIFDPPRETESISKKIGSASLFIGIFTGAVRALNGEDYTEAFATGVVVCICSATGLLILWILYKAVSVALKITLPLALALVGFHLAGWEPATELLHYTLDAGGRAWAAIALWWETDIRPLIDKI